ncbi:hypothetical protein [Ciceribacter ferrooxidans]|uniref:Uncharacterized protein n=1 Tax=Ciceribacter ferrooxidans TaxID=2509717 RepID=A0A4Q2TAY5_9HYPH|nr:hypothetical protein [Ciceribacter ferrooxidans]RYC15242.1 hypothetical protein EUU22_09390 [Ciceribacter ferrooxidans]
MSILSSEGKEGGSDGKEGKDDAARLAGIEAISLPMERFGKGRTDFKRHFFRVDLKQKPDASADLLRKSDEYWQAASDYGLVDSVTRLPDGSVHFVLSLKDEGEIKDLVAADPGVEAGAFTLGGHAKI